MGSSGSREEEEQEERKRSNGTSRVVDVGTGVAVGAALAAAFILLNNSQKDDSSSDSEEKPPPRLPTMLRSTTSQNVAPTVAPKQVEYPMPLFILKRDKDQRLRARDIVNALDEELFPEVLVHLLLLEQRTSLDEDGFSYLWDYEYEVVPGYSQYGRGDFIFSNKSGDSLAVVECKALTNATGKTARTSRNRDRKKLRKQSCTYWQIISTKYPSKKVCCWIFWRESGKFKYSVLARRSAEKGECVCRYH